MSDREHCAIVAREISERHDAYHAKVPTWDEGTSDGMALDHLITLLEQYAQDRQLWDVANDIKDMICAALDYGLGKQS